MESQDKKRPTILFVITQGAWGGAQRYLFDLATSLKQDWSVHVAVGEPDGGHDLQTKLRAADIPVIQLQHLVRRISPIHDLRAVWELRKLYREVRPSIIHLNSSKAGTVGSIAKFKILNSEFKILYTAHGWVFDEPLSPIRRLAYQMMERATARAKDAIITLSQHDAQRAVNVLRIPKEKIHTIPNGISSPTFLPRDTARKKLQEKADTSLSNEQPWISVIAGLYKTKGVDVLLDAVHQRASLQQHPVLILGAGPESKSLKSQVSSLNLSGVHFLGHIENAAQYLKAFDCFVLPSRKEGTPYVLLEAAAADLPIVTTRVGGIEEYFADDPKTVIVAPENPAALGAAIEQALKQNSARDRALSLANLDTMVAATRSLYHSLLQPKSHQ